MLSISFTCSFIFFPILPPSSNSQTKYLAPQKFLFIPVLHIRSLSPKPSGRYLPRVCFICLLVVTYFIFCAQLQSSLKHCDFWAIFLSFFNTIFIKQRQSLSNNDNLYSIVINSLIFFHHNHSNKQGQSLLYCDQFGGKAYYFTFLLQSILIIFVRLIIHPIHVD